MGSWSDTLPAPLNEYTCKVSGFAELEFSISSSIVLNFKILLISEIGFGRCEFQLQIFVACVDFSHYV